MGFKGGYGVAAFGRHQYGAPASVIEPRFNVSNPTSGAHNVALTRWVTFEIYNYSSYLDLDALPYPIEVSEDGGITYEYADVSPYSCTIRQKDGQTVWIKILKSSLWTNNATVVIRVTGTDEYGQEITHTFPVKWST